MIRRRFGYRRELPSINDYSLKSPAIVKMTKALKLDKAPKLDAKADLRKWCSPIVDQGNLGSCTANAAAGIIEYYENKAFGKYLAASRLFIYKATRNLMHSTGDTGATIRSTFGALALFGAPLEEYWPYTDDPTSFDVEPSAFCYSMGSSFKGLNYAKLDGTTNAVKSSVAAGIPVDFGFSVYSSAMTPSVQADGKIPYPVQGEELLGGHSVSVVGYDDALTINHKNGPATQGAFLIRNSWGTTWGDGGYGWLPYKYFDTGLATDTWVLLSERWIDTEQFGFDDS